MSISRHQAVGAYQRWEPTAFDAPPAPEPQPEPIAAEDAPQDHVEPPALPPGFHFPTAEDFERMHEEARAAGQQEGYAEGQAAGHAEGLEAGRAQGYEEGKARAQTEAEQLRTLADNLDAALTRIDEEVAEELLTLSIEIARQVLQHTLAVQPESLIDTVRAALQQLPQAHAQIRLHPDDIALVREHLGEQLGHGGHRLIEDSTLARGGCKVESSGAQIDASMDTRWRRVLESLGREDAAWKTDE